MSGSYPWRGDELGHPEPLPAASSLRSSSSLRLLFLVAAASAGSSSSPSSSFFCFFFCLFLRCLSQSLSFLLDNSSAKLANSWVLARCSSSCCCTSCFSILAQALWSKTTWLYAHAWLTGPVPGAVPTAVFGRPGIARTALCSLCGDDLTLHHVVLCKERNIHAQGICSWPEIFDACCCEDDLKAKITFFGRAVATMCR